MSPYGSQNVAANAIDVDSPEFAAQFGGSPEDESQEVPEIIRSMQQPKRQRTTKGSTSKPKQTEKQRAAAKAKKEKEAAKAREAKAALKAEAAAKREAERLAKAEARQREKLEGPDISDITSKRQTLKPSTVHVPIAELDGIDGGDPVDAKFVQLVATAGRIINPITVRRTEDGRYNIIAGKRRAQAVRALGWETIPATLENRADSNDYVLALQENFGRSHNIVEEHRMVMELIRHYAEKEGDTGANDRRAVAAIAKATGMAVSQIKAAKKVGDLVPELVAAVEDGTMSSWSALRASRLPETVQRSLVDTLNTSGKVTVDDVKVAARHKQAGAVKDIVTQAGETGQNLFDVPEAGEGTESVAGAANLSRTERVARAVTLVQQARALLDALSAKSDDEDDAVQLLDQVVENLTTNP